MPNAVLSHVGLRPGGTDVNENFLTIFTGEVQVAYEMNCVFRNFGYIRTITEGKEARFDVLGKATARYRVKGENLMESGQQIPVDHFIITLDDPLLAHVSVDEIDDFLNHWEIRGRFANQLGLALAIQYDTDKAACLIRAARSTARIPGGDGGSVLTNAAYATDAVKLTEGLYDASATMNKKNLPKQGRKCFIGADHYKMLSQNLNIINNLYGGTGSVKEGEVLRVAGFDLIETNNLPNTNITTNPVDRYNGDFSNTVAVCATDEAVGTLSRVNMITTVDWLPEYKSHLLTAEYLVGHDYFRPECAVELASA